MTWFHFIGSLVRRCIGMTAGAAAVLWVHNSYAEEPPTVAPRPASYLGISGLSINGRIQPHGLPTDYYIEYGTTTDYGNRTESQALPPRLAAYYHETWDEGWNGWRSWDSEHPHFAEGGSSGGHIRYRAIEKDDHNHDDAIGTVHLAKYMYPGRFTPIPSAFLAAGDPDFRDAKISIDVRGNDWQPHGTELMWWSQNQLNPELNPDDGGLSPDYRHSNWCYTGFNLTELLRTGEWEHAEYRLNTDTNDWTYCGNNMDVARYDAYASINDIQRHLNIDFFHMVCFVDTQNRPKGSIDFDEFEVAYRNYSLLLPSNGGSLTSSPEGAGDDPATLTDGWRHGEKRMWKSHTQPSKPLEFTYAFANPVIIDAVQIHQHPEWPSRDIEVLVSNDGQSWTKVVEGTLEEKNAEGPNYNFLLQRPLDAPAKWAKIRILSGYKPEHWGLGEIEFFGAGAVMQTDDDWYHITQDVTGLQPGETYHYRVIAVSGGEKTTGDDQSITLPADTRPHVITGEASRIADGSAKLEGRLNPLGLKTNFYFEYGLDTNYGSQTTTIYGGKMITPRLTIGHAADLSPGKVYHYRLVAENETGRSVGEDKTFTAE